MRNWVDLAQDRNYWRATLNLWVSYAMWLVIYKTTERVNKLKIFNRNSDYYKC